MADETIEGAILGNLTPEQAMELRERITQGALEPLRIDGEPQWHRMTVEPVRDLPSPDDAAAVDWFAHRLCREEADRFDAPGWRELPEEGREGFRRDARSFLTALREWPARGTADA